MDSSGSATSLVADDPAVGELRAALWSAGYTAERVSKLLGAAGERVAVRAGQVPLIERRIPLGDPLGTLVRLFVLSLPVQRADAAAALGTLSVERCAALGPVVADGDEVRATCRLIPTGDLLIVCDLQSEHSADLDPDHVMSITPSTNMLADLTVRRPVANVLDLCCGGGLQALLCARHARRVVATDLNPRALEYAAFAAALNGIDNLDLRRGDLFEPVGDERFDLIVSNPPFVISPDSAYAFRDSPLEGDELSQRVVRGAAARLREGGLAFVLVGWAHRLDQSWSEPLRGWVDGLGCDAWLLHHSSADPFDYAVGFNRPLEPVDPEGYVAAVDRWLDYDRRLGIEAIGYGAIVLRRRTGETWIRADKLHRPQIGPSGNQVARLFHTQDVLAALPSREALLDLALATNEHHRLDQTLRRRGGGYVVEAANVMLEEGLGFRASVDAFAAQMLLRLDGTQTLREALEDAWRELEPGVPLDEFVAAAVPVARRMTELGFLLPPG